MVDSQALNTQKLLSSLLVVEWRKACESMTLTALADNTGVDQHFVKIKIGKFFH